MLEGNRPETKHDGHRVYSPSFIEWYRVFEQSVPHVSHEYDCGFGAESAPLASAILTASDVVMGFEVFVVE
jgi:hypothetical protein